MTGVQTCALPISSVSVFPVVRLRDPVGAAALESSIGKGEERLFVYEGVKEGKGVTEFQFPVDAFAHTDPIAQVRLEARTASGEPLPGWVQFDAVTGVFRGTPPGGEPVSLEVVVTARDGDAREASVVFNLELGALSGVRDIAPGGFEGQIGRAHV